MRNNPNKRGMGRKHEFAGVDSAGSRGRGGLGRRGGKSGRLFDYGELRLLILSMISTQPSHGYELIKSVEERTGGSYTPSPGVIYPTLNWLEELGYAKTIEEDGARKRYVATEEGVAFLKINESAIDDMVARRLGGAGRRKNASPFVVAAMDDLKTALRERFKQGIVDDAAAEKIAAAIRSVAQSIRTERLQSAHVSGQEGMTVNSVETSEINVPAPHVERVRHETRRRKLTVASTEYLTPGMLRIELVGEELADFVSLGADDHIKVFLSTEGEKPDMRDYTPRHYSQADQRLTIDFAVHEAGPATAWALNAKSGDELVIGGPRGSAVIHDQNIKQWLLIGDETALPAIGRRIEEARLGTKITSVVAVANEQEHQNFTTKADLRAHWVHRELSDAEDPSGIIATLKKLTIEPGTYVWIAAEATVTRAVRAYLTEEAGVPLGWLKAAGYWVKGKADTTEKF